MKNAHLWGMWLARVVSVLATIAITTGCGGLNLLRADQRGYDGPSGKDGNRNDVTLPDIQKDQYLSEVSDRFGLMALFALTTYRYDMTPKDRDDHGCAYLEPDFKGDRDFGMPKHVGVGSDSSRWERWVPAVPRDKEVVPCLNRDGLFYETYVYRDSNRRITEAVIAYRGTENRDGQTITDWTSNFSNFFGFEPKQYAIARSTLEKLTEGLYKESKGIPIYAVGHSLGGGLAQQAGYLSRSITAVYTFNTSPVTNWANLRFGYLVKQGYPIIYRVHNGGEALGGIRGIATASTAARFGRYDLGVQFGQKELISGHSIDVLACNFAKVLSVTHAKEVTEAKHGYPLSFINKYVLTPEEETDEEKDTKAAERRKTDRRVCDKENK